MNLLYRSVRDALSNLFESYKLSSLLFVASYCDDFLPTVNQRSITDALLNVSRPSDSSP